MTMRDLFNAVLPERAIQIQTITDTALQSGDIDLGGFNAAEVFVDFGTVEGLSGSPSGVVAVKLEHAEDGGGGTPGTYAEVAVTDVLGPTSVAGGVVATVTAEGVARVGYLGGRRFLRVTLTPTGLGSGGPAGAWVLNGRPRHGPVA